MLKQLDNEYSKCIDLVNGLTSYPTGQDISEVYWRSWLLDNDSREPGERVEIQSKAYTEFLARWIKLAKMLSDIRKPRLGWGSTARASTMSSVICLLLYKLSGPIGLSRITKVLAWIVLWPTTTVSAIVSFLISKFLFQQHRLQRECQDLLQNTDYLSIYRDKPTATSRQFIVTKKGYVGWASPYTFVNDELCFFRGSRIPFAIRRKNRGAKDKRECYRLHGDCYVHGLMNGVQQTSQTWR